MKKLSLLTFLFFGACVVQAQFNNANAVNLPKVDTSPLDVVYFPLNVSKSKDNLAPIMRVLYSRPQKKGREIFGLLERFDKVWRLGANENTEIQFFKPVIIGGRKIKAGRYSAFAIPNKDKWTIIINKQVDKWGAFTYDEQQDVIRVDVPLATLAKPLEVFSITFEETPEGANLVMAWDNTKSALPIAFKK